MAQFVQTLQLPINEILEHIPKVKMGKRLNRRNRGPIISDVAKSMRGFSMLP